MISYIQFNPFREYRGLSTDEKPTEDINNGDKFIEMDSGKIYYYNADGEEWVEFGGNNDSQEV